MRFIDPMVSSARSQTLPYHRSWQKACHYSRHTFFQFDPTQGTVSDRHGQRNLLTTEDFIIGLQKGLEHEVGEASGWLMYLIGQEWGVEDAAQFKVWFQDEFGLYFKDAALRFALETWWWPLTAQGWGKWQVDLSSIKEGFLFIDLFDSAVAKTLGDVGKPVCFLYAGLFAGFFSSFFDRALSSTEIQCYSMGNDFCRFLIGSEKRVKAAEFWLTSGATAADIEARFQALKTEAALDAVGRE
ncbi:V4R domain protein [Picosynechococcus sp. PCC 7002]|nr:V4R domain protein [Picosynechococcus sp. PCC 7002]